MASTDVATRRAAIVAELAALRRAGITRLRSLELPEISRTARSVVGSAEPAAVEQTLRQAITGLGGGEFGDAALVLFGLGQGMRGRSPKELRALAARALDLQPDTFRKNHERRILDQIAEQMVGLVILERVTERASPETPAERQARLERIAGEIAALPAADLGPLVQLLKVRLNVPDREMGTS